MLTRERLLEVLEFDESISRFRWRERKDDKRFNVNFAGKLAGSTNKYGSAGLFYRRIYITGTAYMEHHLVWLHYYGVWPEFDLDHLNGDGLDNRLENLRLDTDCVNSRNQAKHIQNTSGHTNVYWRKDNQNWQVLVRCKRKLISGGCFDAIEEAALKATELREKLGFSPLHGLTREERKANSALAE